MRFILLIISLCLLFAGCRPRSKYLIVKFNHSVRHPAYDSYYSNKVIRKDSCLVFLNLDNDTCRVCDGYLVLNE